MYICQAIRRMPGILSTRRSICPQCRKQSLEDAGVPKGNCENREQVKVPDVDARKMPQALADFFHRQDVVALPRRPQVRRATTIEGNYRIVAQGLGADDLAGRLENARKLRKGVVNIEVVQHARANDDVEVIVRKRHRFRVHDREVRAVDAAAVAAFFLAVSISSAEMSMPCASAPSCARRIAICPLPQQ